MPTFRRRTQPNDPTKLPKSGEMPAVQSRRTVTNAIAMTFCIGNRTRFSDYSFCEKRNFNALDSNRNYPVSTITSYNISSFYIFV